MTIDETIKAAADYVKAAESVVQSFRVLSVQHRTALQTNFPTLSTALALLSTTHRPLDKP